MPSEVRGVVDALSMLGSVSCLLMRTSLRTRTSHGECESGGDWRDEDAPRDNTARADNGEAEWDSGIDVLLAQLLDWLSHVVVLSSVSPQAARQVSTARCDGEGGGGGSLLYVALDVSKSLVGCLVTEGCPQHAEVTELMNVICRLAALPWTAPPNAELGASAGHSAARGTRKAVWSACFCRDDKCDALRLMALLPALIAPHARANALHAAIEVGAAAGPALGAVV